MNNVPFKVLALGASMLIGCNALTGVNDLEVVDGASGVGGTSGTGGGGTGGGGTGGAAEAGTCEPGQKSCGDQCVPIDDPAYGCTETECEPCSFENATATCSDHACQFVACNDDWLDCDSDSLCETRIDDENDCTDNVCGHPPKSVDAPCDQDGGNLCDGDGNCVRCGEGQRRCGGNQPQECDADGYWGELAACQGDKPACSNGYCMGVSIVVTGGGHSCARLSNNTVKCWGDNARGQLGNGEMGGIETRPVATLGYAAEEIFAGAQHTCAITPAGKLECWGANDDGQIGNDVFGGEQLGPMEVPGLSSVHLAALGSSFTCARGQLNSEFGVYCWGAAAKGQLGNGTLTNTNAPTTPVPLEGTAAVSSLSAGESHACAVLHPGEVYCWGNNSNGQIGTLATTQENTPYKVTVDIASSVAAGGWHTCALTVGGVYCWGADSGGQVGDGDPPALKVMPNLVEDGETFQSVSTGGQHTCANIGTSAYCWGRNNHGQVGNGNVLDRPSAVAIDGVLLAGPPAPGGAAGTSATDLPPRGHTCALGSEGNVWCWGSNDVGQLGTGTTADSYVPVPVSW